MTAPLRNDFMFSEGIMPKSDLSFNPDDYALVAERIALFYQEYPTGRIIPRLHAVTENAVIFEARGAWNRRK